MGIYICEYCFERPDPNNPKYSMLEVDIYAWIPYDKQVEYGVQNHRLSLRKNLETGEFEVYRRYHRPLIINRKAVTIFTHQDLGIEEVVFKSKSLEEAVEFANKECEKFHGEIEPDKVCQHKYPHKSSFCFTLRSKRND